MPKKSASARGTAQRAKPKTPKNFELVRPVQDESQAPEAVQPITSSPEPVAVTAPIAASTTSTSGNTESTPAASATSVSAASRLAARRQASQQRQQQRNTPTLITAEHYNYVRKDLIYIAILAVIMLIAIIVLYFVLGINA